MNAAVVIPSANFAEIANKEHDLACAHTHEAVKHAKKCGDALLAAKEQIGHGGFMEWIKNHFEGSDRSARSYMHVASNWQRIANLEPASLTEALCAIKEVTPPKARAATTAPARPSPATLEAEIMEPPLVVDAAKPATTATDEPPGAMITARKATWQLDTIKSDDPNIRGALDFIINYCNTRKNEITLGRGLR